MNTKIAFVAALAALSTFAVAQNNLIEGARGHGLLVSDNAQKPDARTKFNAVRFLDQNNEEKVGGHVEFMSQGQRGSVTINGRVARLAVNGDQKSAQFGGEGIAFVRTNQGPKRVAGNFVVQVQDNGQKGQGKKDTFRITFTEANNGQFRFEYTGVVARGEITVKPKAPNSMVAQP